MFLAQNVSTKKKRLADSRLWLQSLNSEKIAKAYRKHFGVDWATAFRELELLGVQVPADYKETVIKSVTGQAEVRKRMKAEKLATLDGIEQDETFAYIAGYTSGGAPYGITWAEWKELDDVDE